MYSNSFLSRIGRNKTLDKVMFYCSKTSMVAKLLHLKILILSISIRQTWSSTGWQTTATTIYRTKNLTPMLQRPPLAAPSLSPRLVATLPLLPALPLMTQHLAIAALRQEHVLERKSSLWRVSVGLRADYQPTCAGI